MYDIDYEKLRSDLIDYYGTAIAYNPMAVIELGEVENASINKLVQIAMQNGFDLSDYDERCIKFASDYSVKLLAIDVNIDVDEMLDTTWDLFGKYFKPTEVSIKQNLMDKYWKGN
jgi:vacuolar-type H+-ATPase subunit B/Vma2